MSAKIAPALAAAVLALALPLVAKWEGVRTTPYRDIVGIWTVCYGQTGKPANPGNVYTMAECRSMLAAKLPEYHSGVLACTSDTLPVPVQAAFTSFAYNVGTSAFCGSSVARYARQNRLDEACQAMGKWVYAGGKYSQGLANRRVEEIALCKRGTRA